LVDRQKGITANIPLFAADVQEAALVDATKHIAVREKLLLCTLFGIRRRPVGNLAQTPLKRL